MFSALRRTDPDDFQFNWLDVMASSWQGNRAYTATMTVRPQRKMGFYAECLTAGQSGLDEPRWVAQDGATVRDGSIVWTMRHPSSVSLPTITAVTYTFNPAGITQGTSTISGSTTIIKLDASSASLGIYAGVAEITAGGEDYSLGFEVTVID